MPKVKALVSKETIEQLPKGYENLWGVILKKTVFELQITQISLALSTNGNSDKNVAAPDRIMFLLNELLKFALNSFNRTI